MTIARIIIVLTGLLCPAFLANAQDLAVNGSPYTPIVTRNIFGLLPIPTNAPVDPTPAAPPPKITLNGITTIFGSKEALYKVATPPKPGQPAGDMSYALGENEGQDDIEVVKIDTDADIVTFNNHGTIQDLPLSTAPNLSTPAAVPAPGGVPGLPVPGGPFNRFRRPGVPGFAGVANSSAYGGGGTAQSSGTTPSAGIGTPNPSTYGNTSPSAGGYEDPQMQGLSPEAQALLIEQSRVETQDAVNKGLMPPLPPTAITPPDATAQDGTPLIAPNNPVEKK
jgi:hypothetical protein